MGKQYHHQGHRGRHGNGGRGQNNDERKREWAEFKSRFDPNWISNKFDRKAIDFAMAFGHRLAKGNLTNTNIRNFFSEVKRIHSKPFEEGLEAFHLLPAKVTWVVARFKNQPYHDFRDIILEAHKAVETEGKADTRQQQFNRFVNFLEATLAYHREGVDVLKLNRNKRH